MLAGRGWQRGIAGCVAIAFAAGVVHAETCANLGSIAAGAVGENFGSYLVVRQNPDQTLSGYHMEFAQDSAGVWRISDM